MPSVYKATQLRHLAFQLFNEHTYKHTNKCEWSLLSPHPVESIASPPLLQITMGVSRGNPRVFPWPSKVSDDTDGKMTPPRRSASARNAAAVEREGLPEFDHESAGIATPLSLSKLVVF